MNAASVDNARPWTVTQAGGAAALEIVSLKRTYVLPWSQLLYAEGGEDEVRLSFAAHDVIVRGSGLEALLADVAAQRVGALRESSRADRFSGSVARTIREIVVERVEGDR